MGVEWDEHAAERSDAHLDDQPLDPVFRQQGDRVSGPDATVQEGSRERPGGYVPFAEAHPSARLRECERLAPAVAAGHVLQRLERAQIRAPRLPLPLGHRYAATFASSCRQIV
jgi:hypothetical protein